MVQRDMKMIKEAGLITFVGAPKTGKYRITDKLSQIKKPDNNNEHRKYQ